MFQRLQDMGCEPYPAGAKECAEFAAEAIGRWADAINARRYSLCPAKTSNASPLIHKRINYARADGSASAYS